MTSCNRNVYIEFNGSRTPRVLVDGVRMKGVTGVAMAGDPGKTPLWTISLHPNFVTAGPGDAAKPPENSMDDDGHA